MLIINNSCKQKIKNEMGVKSKFLEKVIEKFYALYNFMVIDCLTERNNDILRFKLLGNCKKGFRHHKFKKKNNKC